MDRTNVKKQRLEDVLITKGYYLCSIRENLMCLIYIYVREDIKYIKRTV